MAAKLDIGRTMVQAIKNEMFLDVTYLNLNNEKHHFWLAVTDIDFTSKKFVIKGKIYNPDINVDECKDVAKLSFNSILTAEIKNFTHYDVPKPLLEKLEQNKGKVPWLEYDADVRVLLDYYKKCHLYDNDPYQHEHTMISGLDCDKLLREGVCRLSVEQKKEVVDIIRRYKDEGSHVYQLAISRCAVDDARDHTYVICYYDVMFDPVLGTLCIDDTLRFNYTFLKKKALEHKVKKGDKASLFQYVEGDLEAFVSLYDSDEESAVSIITENLRAGEMINTRPEVMILERDFNFNVDDTFEKIVERYQNGELLPPLKSFFGVEYRRHRVEPDIIVCDDKINIDQARVLYNAMKQPVTYVQGPPGTGKTQTIINVILNVFYNEKTLLVCSSNNKPVDGIMEKLDYDYNGEKIPFPFIRLGNSEQMDKAMAMILRLYDYHSRLDPDETKLSKIKASTNAHHATLKEMLERQERHADYDSMLESANLLLKELGAYKPSRLTDNINQRVAFLEDTLKNNPRVENDELAKLFTPLERNPWLKQYMYFSSLKCIQKLKNKSNKDLIEICRIDDIHERRRSFVSWLSSDENMSRLIKIFPVVFSTNISARRLGSPDFMFDLVIMDEAGQCNVVQSLIPITKARSLLLVGDPQQLRPVIVLEQSFNRAFKDYYGIMDSYDYCRNSILDIMRSHDRVSNYVLLKYHYRCGSDIIGFSNKKYYDSALNLSAIKERGELVFLDVKNKNVVEKNAAYDEAKAVVDYIIQNNMSDVAIITPFVNQKDLINSLLAEKNLKNVECYTIHKMQGGEKNTIVFSTALSPKTSKRTFEWLKNNEELINVGVTRAKKRLVIANDYEVIKKLSQQQNDLLDLVEYVRSNGKTRVPLNEALKIEIGKSNNSRYEAHFYKTIAQFCSVHDTFKAERNVGFSKIFKDDELLGKSGREFDCVLYERSPYGFIPKIVIEINGGEHYASRERRESDIHKMRICKERGIEFLMIPNTFVKSYNELKAIILKSKDARDIQTSFDFDE